MKEGLEFMDLSHITAKASFGRCKITGLVRKSFYTVHIYIVFSKFGSVNLELPEATER